MPSLKKLSKHLLRISAGALLLAVAYGFGSTKPLLPAYAETAPACACYCGTPDAGAVKFSAEQDAGACQAFCTSVQKDYLGCFLPGSQNPENDLKCWTESECAHYATDKLGNVTKGIWGGQNEKCARPLSNAEAGYCYAPGLPVHLGIPILGTVFSRISCTCVQFSLARHVSHCCGHAHDWRTGIRGFRRKLETR